MNDLLSAHLATRLTAAAVLSARPDAPVVGHREARAPRTRALRVRLAAELRTVARWIEPRATNACQPG